MLLTTRGSPFWKGPIADSLEEGQTDYLLLVATAKVRRKLQPAWLPVRRIVHVERLVEKAGSTVFRATMGG